MTGSGRAYTRHHSLRRCTHRKSEGADAVSDGLILLRILDVFRTALDRSQTEDPRCTELSASDHRRPEKLQVTFGSPDSRAGKRIWISRLAGECGCCAAVAIRWRRLPARRARASSASLSPLSFATRSAQASGNFTGSCTDQTSHLIVSRHVKPLLSCTRLGKRCARS